MKKAVSIVASSAIIATLFSGCGSDGSSVNSGSVSSSSQSSTNSKSTVVTAIDGYVLEANVKDSAGKVAQYIPNSKGEYKFDGEPTYPIVLTGGKLDSNSNGIVDSGEIDFGISMQANKGVIISPISTIISKGANEEKLANLLNVSTEYLYTNPMVNEDINLAKAYQILYAIIISEATSDIVTLINSDTTAQADGNNSDVIKFIQTIQPSTKDTLYTYIDSVKSAQVASITDLEELLKNEKTNLAGVTYSSSSYSSTSSVLSSSSSVASSLVSDLPAFGESHHSDTIVPVILTTDTTTTTSTVTATVTTPTVVTSSSSSVAVITTGTSDLPNFGASSSSSTTQTTTNATTSSVSTTTTTQTTTTTSTTSNLPQFQ